MRLPNGYGGITKLSGKRRRPFMATITQGFDVTDDGKLRQKRVAIGYYATKKEALQALSEYHNAPFALSDIKITFSALYDRWSSNHFKGLSDNTVKTYKNAYKHCKPLYDMPIKDIRTGDIQAAVDGAGVQRAGQQAIISLCVQIMDYAIQNDIINKNYAHYCKASENTSSLQRKPFTEAEISTLKALHTDTADIILVLIYTGWRVQELLNLTAADVDLAADTMTGGIKTAAGKNRVVPIHSCIKPIIQRFADTHSTGALFGYRNYPPFWYAFREVCQAIGSAHTVHDTRHTFATRADNYGLNPIAAKKILGHSAGSSVTEKVYTHKDIEQLKAEIEKLPPC